MRKGILLLMFALVFGSSCFQIDSVSAETSKDILEVKHVLETYYKSFTKRDLDSMLRQLSRNYSEIKDGNVIDYAKCKTELEELMNTVFETYSEFAISDLEVLNSEIVDDKADVDILFNWRGLNRENLKQISGRLKRHIALAKEGNLWKITQVVPLPPLVDRLLGNGGPPKTIPTQD